MTATSHRVDNLVDDSYLSELSREELSFYSFGGDPYPTREFEYDRFMLALEVQEYNRRNRVCRLTQLQVEAIRDLILDYCENSKVNNVDSLSRRKSDAMLEELRLVTGYSSGTVLRIVDIIVDECDANAQDSIQGLCAEQTVRMVGEIMRELRSQPD